MVILVEKKMAIPGVPGGLIIYQGHLFTLKDMFFGWEGCPTKIDYRKKEEAGTLILTSLLEDLAMVARRVIYNKLPNEIHVEGKKKNRYLNLLVWVGPIVFEQSRQFGIR